MCEYQRISTSPTRKPTPPKCKYTGEYCTCCVYGNAETYNKAKQNEAKKH